MRYHTRLTLPIISVVLAPALLRAQEPPSSTHLAAAIELLEVTNARALVDQTILSLRHDMGGRIPGMDSIPGLDSLLNQMLVGQFGWDAMEADIVQIYLDTFNESELREITAFYRTELGRKLLDRMPEILQRSMALTQQRLQHELPKIMKEIHALIERNSRGRRN